MNATLDTVIARQRAARAATAAARRAFLNQFDDTAAADLAAADTAIKAATKAGCTKADTSEARATVANIRARIKADAAYVEHLASIVVARMMAAGVVPA